MDFEEQSKMSREIYVPIADSFFESSIMREDLTVRFVMLALIRLALRAGANGEVDMDPLMFAASINIPLADVESAIRRLMEPDPASSTPDEDGRRIVPVNPDRPFRNWRLVNWSKYRRIVHRANDAARKREERHGEEDNMDTSESLQKRPPLSGNGATNTNTNTNNEEDISLVRSHSEGVSDSSVRVRYAADFEEFWMAFSPPSRRLGKGAASKIWKRLSLEDRQKAVEMLPAFKEANRGKEDRHIATAPTYLSQRRFDDFDGTPPPVDKGHENYQKQLADLAKTMDFK